MPPNGSAEWIGRMDRLNESGLKLEYPDDVVGIEPLERDLFEREREFLCRRHSNLVILSQIQSNAITATKINPTVSSIDCSMTGYSQSILTNDQGIKKCQKICPKL